MTIIKGYTRRREPKWPFLLTIIVLLIAVAIVLLNFNPPKPQPSDETSSTTSTSTTVSTTLTSTTIKAITSTTIGEVGRIEITRAEGKIYCHTRLTLDPVPQVIHHIWVDPEGNAFADIKLTISRQPADTYSYISRYGGKTGTWQVRVQKEDGTVLATQSFEVN